MAAPGLLKIASATLRPQAALEIAFPALPAHGALCIGVTLAPQQLAQIRAGCADFTSPFEQERAARFLHSADAVRHLLGRALLRRAALAYGLMSGQEEFALNPWGKPLLPGAGLQANISHSGMQVWLALARDAEIGIDVESAQAPADFPGIARAFHAQERQSIGAAQDPAQAMMRCWSRKEAVAKAIGRGLSLPLDAYAVDCGAGTADWLRQAPAGSALSSWTCIDLPPLLQHVGALAIHGECRQIAVWQLNIEVTVEAGAEAEAQAAPASAPSLVASATEKT